MKWVRRKQRVRRPNLSVKARQRDSGEQLADPVGVVGGRRVVLVDGQVLRLGVAAEAIGHQAGGMQEVAYTMLHGQLQRMVGALHIDLEHLVKGRNVVGNGRQVDDGLGPLHGIGKILAVQDAAGDVADVFQTGRGRRPVEGRDLVTSSHTVQQEIAAHSAAGGRSTECARFQVL